MIQRISSFRTSRVVWRKLTSRQMHGEEHSALLGVLARLEARLLNPLVAETLPIVASVEEICKLDAEVPLSFAADAVRLAAARREHAAVQHLLQIMAKNMHGAEKTRPNQQHHARKLPTSDKIRLLDPFSQLAGVAVSSSTFYSAHGGVGGMYLWKELNKKYGYVATRDTLLDVLHGFYFGRRMPSSAVVRAVVGLIMENRWEQKPVVQISLLRLMRGYFNPHNSFRRHFTDDLNMLKEIAACSNTVLSKDGKKIIQHELMHTWLVASQAARRLTDDAGNLRAEACLLEALKILDNCLTPASQESSELLPTAGREPPECNRVAQSMMSLASALETELVGSWNVSKVEKQHSHINSPIKNRNLLLKSNIFSQSQKGRAAVGAVLAELSRLGRYSEMLNALRRLFSTPVAFDLDTRFVSNGMMDNTKVVLYQDIVASPFPEGFGAMNYSYPGEPVGKLEQLRSNVARKSVFRIGNDGRTSNWSQYSRDMNDVDWRGRILADILRACDLSQQSGAHMTRQERFDRVGDLATKLMAAAASEGIKLGDDFRAAWISSLPHDEEFQHALTNALPLVGDSDLNARSHSILRTTALADTIKQEIQVSNTPASGQFVYSIDRKTMVDVNILAHEAEQALIENAKLRMPKKPKVFPVIKTHTFAERRALSLESMSRVVSHIDDTIFSEFTVSSFSKSRYAGDAVLTEAVGDIAHGAMIQYLSQNYGQECMPEILRMLQKYGNESVMNEYPAAMWTSVIQACGGYCSERGSSELLAELDACLNACSVTQRHPEILKDLLHMNCLLKNGPNAVQIMRSMRRSGVSATYEMYRDVLHALFRFRFDPDKHEQYAQLFLRPQETANWLLREMKRDAVKIPAEFYGDLMLLFVKNARVWAAVSAAKSGSAESHLHKPEYGGSDSVFTPSSTNNASELEEVIGEAISFLRNSVKHRSHEKFNEIARSVESTMKGKLNEKEKTNNLFELDTFAAASRPSRQKVSNPTEWKPEPRKTITGETFLYRIDPVLKGIAAQRELLLRRLLIIICEAGNYELAKEMMMNSVTTFGIAPTSRCYEVLLDFLLLRGDGPPPAFVAAEDMISEIMNQGLLVTGPMLDMFGRAHILRLDASEALDCVQEMSTQHRVMPSPIFLRELIEFSLRNGNEMEARRVLRAITDMKWDKAAVKPKAAKLRSLFPKDIDEVYEKPENHSLTSSLIDAMKMLFSGSTASYDNSDSGTQGKQLSGPSDGLDKSVRTMEAMFEDGRARRDNALSQDSLRELFLRYDCVLDEEIGSIKSNAS